LLEKRLFARFCGEDASGGLPGLCLNLLSEQNKTWAVLRNAYSAIKDVSTRHVQCAGFSVILQHNPGRATSSLARVDEKKIRKRECFLCVENLPKEQKAILYRDRFLILCNPAPVFPFHYTVSCLEHRTQAIASDIEVYLQLMADLGPDWTALYNGPKCGASAPDHLHFQAIPRGKLPIEQEIEEDERLEMKAQRGRAGLFRVKNAGREVVMLSGDDPKALDEALRAYIDSLKEASSIVGADDEPMLNIAGSYLGAVWRLLVFPRRKHRPDVFFREGDSRIVVSPAVVEMAGVIVTPVQRDFKRVDAAMIENIYREVSLPDGQ
jgi:Domain of unknown function (DUF4922)